MAADSGAWIGDSCIPWARKLVRGSDGTLYGCAGDAGEIGRFIEWVDSGCTGERPAPRSCGESQSSFIVLEVGPSDDLRVVTATGFEPYRAPYFSIGAGSPTAFGALWVGASAEQAIEAACWHGNGCQWPVQSIRRE